MEKAKGAPGPGRGKAGSKAGPAFDDTPTLRSHGISKTESSRWQKLASIPDDQFEATFAKPNGKPSTNGMIAAPEEGERSGNGYSHESAAGCPPVRRGCPILSQG
jgi:hypothetical protein